MTPSPNPPPPHQRPTQPFIGPPRPAPDPHFDPTVGMPRFKAIRLLGAGGIGRVHLVRDSSPHRLCALKDLQPRSLRDARLVDQFHIEMYVTAGLDHPNNMPLYTGGTDVLDRPYYAMPYVLDARSLRSLIRKLHPRNGSDGEPDRPCVDLRKGTNPSELRAILRRFLDACRGVAHANGRGVIHRDIKSDNIMISPYEEVTYVSDWGMALITGLVPPGYPAQGALPPEPNGRKCLPGMVGTPNYMAPERLRGEEYDWRSDVYSLGATLYEVVTGRVPYDDCKGKAEILNAIDQARLRSPQSWNPSVDRKLEAVIFRAMAASPKRYRDADALANDLQHYLDDEPIAAAPDQISDRMARALRKHRRETTVGVLALAIIAIGSLVAAFVFDALGRAAEQARLLAEARRVKVYDYLGQGFLVVDSLVGAGEAAFGPTDAAATRQIEGLESALGFYELYLRDQANDRAIHHSAARAARRLGDLYNLRADTKLARKRYEQALGHFTASATGDRAIAEAKVRIELAYVHHLDGRAQEAIGELERAEALLGDSADDATRRAKARAQYRRAEILLARARDADDAASNDSKADIEEAGRCVRRALKLLTTARSPEDRVDKTQAHAVAADQRLVTGDRVEAGKELRNAMALVDGLGQDPTTAHDDVVPTLRCIIVAKLAQLPAEVVGDDPGPELDRAIDQMTRLSARMKGLPMYRALLADGLVARARRRIDLGDEHGALVDAQRGIVLAQGLADERPTTENLRRAQEATEVVEGLNAAREGPR